MPTSRTHPIVRPSKDVLRLALHQWLAEDASTATDEEVQAAKRLLVKLGEDDQRDER